MLNKHDIIYTCFMTVLATLLLAVLAYKTYVVEPRSYAAWQKVNGGITNLTLNEWRLLKADRLLPRYSE